jgi:cell division protease FtsH
MAVNPWLPVGFVISTALRVDRTAVAGDQWQIVETTSGERVLIAQPELVDLWTRSGLVPDGIFAAIQFGTQQLQYLASGPHHALSALSEAKSPNDKGDALAFAKSLKQSRAIDRDSPLQDAVYVERISRLLPSYSISSRTPDDVVLGSWLSGGVPVSARAFRRLHQAVSWLGVDHLKEVVEAAGIEVQEVMAGGSRSAASQPRTEHLGSERLSGGSAEPFRLPGRPELESFFNEHVVDVLQHRERYKALGIGFPSAVVLHGPAGSGKTYAVERLVEYLGWPSFQIDAASIASPFIHETSRKVAEVFDKAMDNSPSVLVIDEMEAFLADREQGLGSSHHRVEEVAEFLRRIPDATKNDVLIIAMTNRIEMIDTAILRRGRFDHVIKVGYASREEVHSLLQKLLSNLPLEGGVDIGTLADGLSNRPLSDVAFVIREGARLAARAGKSKLDQQSLSMALAATPARRADGDPPRRVGFI